MVSAALLPPIAGILGGADLALLGLVAVAAVLGFLLGLVWMLVMMGMVVGCIWLTLLYHPVVAEQLGTRFSESVRLMGSAAAVFVGALLVCGLLAYLFRDIVNSLKPHLTDRLLGLAFGTLLAGILCAFVAFVAMQYGGEGTRPGAAVENSTVCRALGICFRHALPDRLRHTATRAGGRASGGQP